MRTNTIDYFSASTGVVATTHTEYSNTWTTNPNTGAAWTWSEVNALEAGVRSIRNGGTWTGEMRATKVWVVVDYVDSQAPTTIISTTPSTRYSDTGLAASTTYYYRVRAYDGAGNESSYSNVAAGPRQTSKHRSSRSPVQPRGPGSEERSTSLPQPLIMLG